MVRWCAGHKLRVLTRIMLVFNAMDCNFWAVYARNGELRPWPTRDEHGVEEEVRRQCDLIDSTHSVTVGATVAVGRHENGLCGQRPSNTRSQSWIEDTLSWKANTV